MYSSLVQDSGFASFSNKAVASSTHKSLKEPEDSNGIWTVGNIRALQGFTAATVKISHNPTHCNSTLLRISPPCNISILLKYFEWN